MDAERRYVALVAATNRLLTMRREDGETCACEDYAPDMCPYCEISQVISFQPDPTAYSDIPQDIKDRRTNCWFCPGVTAVAVAPRHSHGDTDIPAHWVPVCASHRDDWYSYVPKDERLPMFSLEA